MAHPDTRSGSLSQQQVDAHRNNRPPTFEELASKLCDQVGALQRKLARYEQAFGNIETIIDGKAEASLEDGRYQSNDYGQIQSAIDEARR